MRLESAGGTPPLTLNPPPPPPAPPAPPAPAVCDGDAQNSAQIQHNVSQPPMFQVDPRC